MKKGDVGLPVNVVVIIIISIISLITLILLIAKTCILGCQSEWEARYREACLKLVANCGLSWDDAKLEVDGYTLHQICMNQYGAEVNETTCKSCACQ